MRKFTLLLLLLSATVFAQKSINNYKYIIVPKQFDFLKTADKYRTSSLTKFLFNKNGFTAFISDEELPAELANNRCLALIAEVKNNSNMFTTKNNIELKDCNNNVVYTSQEGKSKIKDYKRAYHEAIREAFNSIKRLNYNYTPAVNHVDSELASSPQGEFQEVQTEVVEKVIKERVVKLSENDLFAQPKKNGYQLINTKPEIVFELLNTNVKDVYIIKNKNGILYKNNNNWIAEYYENNVKITTQYNVKF